MYSESDDGAYWTRLEGHSVIDKLACHSTQKLNMLKDSQV